MSWQIVSCPNLLNPSYIPWSVSYGENGLRVYTYFWKDKWI